MANKGTTSPTRMAPDLVAAAAAVAPLEDRSVAGQLNHWARVGMQIERSESLMSRRVLAVAAGQGQLSELSDDERRAANALIDARIADRAASVRFGAAARAAGQTTVSMDDDGHLVEISPDGTRRRL